MTIICSQPGLSQRARWRCWSPALPVHRPAQGLFFALFFICSLLCLPNQPPQGGRRRWSDSDPRGGKQWPLRDVPGGQDCASTLLLMSHPNRGFLAPKWVTHHFCEIHICGAAPLSINAILPICEGLVAASMSLCAVVNTSHPHIPETHQESRMKAFVG